MPSKNGALHIALIARAVSLGLAALDDAGLYDKYDLQKLVLARNIRHRIMRMWILMNLYPGDEITEPYPITLEPGGQISLQRLLALDPMQSTVVNPDEVRQDLAQLFANLRYKTGGIKHVFDISGVRS